MTTQQKIQSTIELNRGKMDDLQRQEAQWLEHIEQCAREARERGDARGTYDTLEYDVRQLAEAFNERGRLNTINRMLEYFLRDEEARA